MLVAPGSADVESRLLAKVRYEESGCWIWEGYSTEGASGNRYGRISVAGRSVYTHRLAYETWTGPLADGAQVDHTCRHTLCINPEHLEQVSNSENQARKPYRPRKTTFATMARRRRRFCQVGHKLQWIMGKWRCPVCPMKPDVIDGVYT